MEADLAARIEPCAALSWPAAEVVSRAGWMLRFSTGFTRRANSTATGAFPGAGSGSDLAGAIAFVEAEYARRRLPPMFQLTPASQPADLDAVLSARGYERCGDACVCVSTPGRTRELLPDPGDLRMTTDADEAFSALVVAGARSPADGRERLDILARVADPRVCVTALADGAAVAVGTACWREGLVGINLVRTRAEHRRRGHARRVVAAIAAWALEREAALLYLGVEVDNAAALALYQAAGFRVAYPYHFRRRPG